MLAVFWQFIANFVVKKCIVMKPVLDLHTHTIMSGHAFSTLQEMVCAARDKGLEYLGISDHGPAVPGACDPIYFRNLYVVPREIDGVKLLMGAELNILDYSGTLDLDSEYYCRLDYVIAGLHRVCYKAGSKRQNTDAILGAMHNARVNIISHPVDGTGDVFIEELVGRSAQTGTLLEVNNSSLHPVRNKYVAVENNLHLLRLCRQKQLPVILGSDAHISYSVADYSYLGSLLKETDFPDELIVNYYPAIFEQFTGVRLDTAHNR